MKTLIVVAALTFLCTNIHAGTPRSPGVIFRDSSSSSVVITRDTVDGYEQVDQIATTSSYHLVTDWQNNIPRALLLRETNTEHMNSTMEGTQGRIVLHVFSGEDNFQKEIWKKTIDANTAEY